MTNEVKIKGLEKARQDLDYERTIAMEIKKSLELAPCIRRPDYKDWVMDLRARQVATNERIMELESRYVQLKRAWESANAQLLMQKQATESEALRRMYAEQAYRDFIRVAVFGDGSDDTRG